MRSRGDSSCTELVNIYTRVACKCRGGARLPFCGSKAHLGSSRRQLQGRRKARIHAAWLHMVQEWRGLASL